VGTIFMIPERIVSAEKETSVHYAKTSINDLLGHEYTLPVVSEELKNIAESPLHIFRFDNPGDVHYEYVAIVDTPIDNRMMMHMLAGLAPFPGRAYSFPMHEAVDLWKGITEQSKKSTPNRYLDTAPEDSLFRELIVDFLDVAQADEQKMFEAAQYGGMENFKKRADLERERTMNYYGYKVKTKFDRSLGAPVITVNDQNRYVVDPHHMYVEYDFKKRFSSNVLIPSLRWWKYKYKNPGTDETDLRWDPLPLGSNHHLFQNDLREIRKNALFNALITSTGDYEGLKFSQQRMSPLMGLISTTLFLPDVYTYWNEFQYHTVKPNEQYQTTYITGAYVPKLVIHDSKRILNSQLVKNMMNAVTE